jgi:hypothetical protein
MWWYKYSESAYSIFRVLTQNADRLLVQKSHRAARAGKGYFEREDLNSNLTLPLRKVGHPVF